MNAPTQSVRAFNQEDRHFEAWTVHKTYMREHNPRWLEYSCQPPAGHVFVGKDEYVLSADGKLMPVREAGRRRT